MWKDIVLRLRALFFRRRMDEELQEELGFHIEMEARKSGQREARLKFGSVSRATEECRDQRGISSIEILAKDLRFAVRMLRKSPGFAGVAVVTLALGIGANAVVFGMMNGLILRPLNVPEAESLWGIEHGNATTSVQSYPDYLDLRDRNRSFEDLAAYSFVQAGLDTGENPSRVWGIDVTGNYFDVLRIQPYVGRFFHSSDEHGPNSAAYLVRSYVYWHSRFQDDRGIVAARFS